LLTLFSYRYVQAFVEHTILGVSLPPRDLLELYSERITTSTSLVSLQTILADEILPRLHIQQFVFLQVEKGTPRVLQTVGIVNLPIQNALLLTGKFAGKYRTPETADSTDPSAWVRLALELKIDGEMVGIWLFGRRDPDDFYSQTEINLIQILANQTAIALSNILQTQRVSEMYQQDISRHENERMRLALELHDSILNQLATMLLRLDDKSISPHFQEAYDELIDRLREIVSNLRPPMLNYGLKPALDELAESLTEHDKDGLVFTLDLQSDESRYPTEVEQHLFRIVQEACENSLRHGLARNISITGELLPDKINLTIADNGRGFDTGKGFSLATLLSNKHFGLAGMLERAAMIGGDVKIESSPETGTQVRFHWASPT
jgi:signal transduction histidine kinase